MSLTYKLLTGTGVLHCMVGFCIPELRDPTLRVLSELTVESTSLPERYAREAGVWFQVGGITMMMLGGLIASSRKEAPKWFGWSLVGLGGVGATIMPKSGFWFLLFQGIRIVWIQQPSTNKIA